MPAGLRLPDELLPEEPDVEVHIDGPVDTTSIDPDTGALETVLDDGSVEVDISPDLPANDGPDNFGDNLALKISDAELNRISEELLRGIQTDEESRSEWLQTRAQGIRLLGLKIEDPQSAGADASTAVAGQSTVRNPLLLEATLRFQANARGELLPSDGPVKVSDKIDENNRTDQLAEALEDDFNYYLTTVATEYYPDTDRALFSTGFGGCSFKKVYFCPIRLRPVSESVDAKDLIVSNASTDMRNSARVTHQILMRPSVLKRMQLAGAYRSVPLTTPNPQENNPVQQEIAEVQGIQPDQTQGEDRDHLIYEVYCELDVLGFEDKQDGEKTGLPLPYRVVIEKDSRQVLEVRRNWEKDDDRKLTKLPFVKYPFVPGLGFYDIGFIHILGNTTNALTAAWRELLDAGMFANFPGFIYDKGFGRQNTNEFRVPPGGGVGLDVPAGKKIGEAIMPIPYKTPDAGFVSFVEQIEQTGQRLGGTAEMNIGEGKQDAPVGTTLALIEQATKVEGAVHKRLHAAQAEEFQLLKACFRDHPDSFIQSVRRKGAPVDWNEGQFLAALNDATLVPQADPNTPSHMHRLMKAMGMVQLDKAYQGVFNSKEVAIRAARMLGVDDVDGLLNTQPPAAAPPNPDILLANMKGQQQQAKEAAEARSDAVKVQLAKNESADQAAERQSRENIARIHLTETMIDAHKDRMNGSAPQ